MALKAQKGSQGTGTPLPTTQPREQLKQKPSFRTPARGQGLGRDGATRGRRGECLQDSILTPRPRGPTAEHCG